MTMKNIGTIPLTLKAQVSEFFLQSFERKTL